MRLARHENNDAVFRFMSFVWDEGAKVVGDEMHKVTHTTTTVDFKSM